MSTVLSKTPEASSEQAIYETELRTSHQSLRAAYLEKSL